MSNTIRKRKHNHLNALRKQYWGNPKLETGVCSLSCCGDHFGRRYTRGAKAKRRRYMRHVQAKQFNVDILAEIQSLLKEIL